MRTTSHTEPDRSATPLHPLRQRVVARYPAARRLGRPVRFGLVGLSGVVVNTAVLWLLVKRAGFAVPIGSALASEVAIITNFWLNDRWTFRAAVRQHRWWQRLIRFNGVALGGVLITALLLTLLTTSLHLSLLLANLIAVASATGWNYIINSRWTWRGSGEAYADSARVGQ